MYYNDKDNKTNINKINENGYNLLHMAVINNNTELLKFLINKGAIIDKKTKGSGTSLDIAVKLRQEEVIKLLYENDANVNETSINMWTPLHLAVIMCHLDQSVTDADPEEPATVKLSKIDKLLVLLQNNFGCNGQRMPLSKPLCPSENTKITSLLLEYEADPNAKDKNSMSPLHWAIRLGLERTIELLLKSGANVNEIGKNGYPPLHEVVLDNDKDMMSLLLELGADANAKDLFGNTPLYYALKLELGWIVELLLKKGALVNEPVIRGCPPLEYAIKANNAELVELLLRYGASAEEKASNEESLLQYASFRASAEVVELLLKKAGRPNEIGKYGLTPLHMAVNRGNARVVELLISHGADVNGKADNGESPLQRAVFWPRPRLVELLLRKGARVNEQDANGCTALHKAVESGKTEMAMLLLEYGADVNAQDKEGTSPFSFATDREEPLPLQHLLTKHLATLDPDELCAKNRRILKYNGLLRSFYNDCLQEVRRMRNSRLHCTTSVYNALVERGCYLGNGLELLKEIICRNSFPIYHDRLTEAYDRCCRYSRLFDAAETKLAFLWDRYHLSKEIVHMILQHLSIDDLEVIVEAGESGSVDSTT